MRILHLAAILSVFYITNTLPNPPTQDQVPSLEHLALKEILESQDANAKPRAAIFHQSEQAEALAMKCMRSSQDPAFMLYAAGHLRNYLRFKLGISNVIKTYEKMYPETMEAEILKWSERWATPQEIWLLYRFMKTPMERYSYYDGRYHLNSYWTSRIYSKPEMYGAVSNYILGMDLEWDQLKNITFRDPSSQNKARSWVDIKTKEVGVGPNGRLQSLMEMDSEDRRIIETETNYAMRIGTLGFTLRQADELSKIFASSLNGRYQSNSASSYIRARSDDFVERYSAIPKGFGFDKLAWDQKVALRQLALVVEVHWGTFKEIIIDSGYL
ncbi:hypothetical protein FRB94_010498 [Tulasnella sp. JGI-2019a]|nr:hypothetical protein FRB93_003144 [Tulasnella sp. JGI-2019a]KAG8993646.1 hypothetical protein FRB94_010498 [Tulasnella sp. JGI-2019a]KAG9033056.1 hypothetical protein FRB95_000642 [Tulasnella sp. JGI-2019a]